MTIKITLGQDSHRFSDDPSKPMIIGGYVADGAQGFDANSDGDVILHALTNAISGLTGRNILGKVADDLCRQGIIDSRVYLQEALDDLNKTRFCISHVSISLEGKQPKFEPIIPEIKKSVASLLDLQPANIGLTATTGEALTEFGKGLGIQCLCIVTFESAPLENKP